MSDVMMPEFPEGTPPLVPMLYTSWSANIDTVRIVDDKLNTDAGATAISRKAVDTLPEGVADRLNSTVRGIFQDMSVEQQAAVLYLITQATADYKPTVKKFIEAEQAKMPTVEMPEAEVAALRDSRKDGVKGANALRVAVMTAAPSWANVEVLDADGNVRKNDKGEPITQLDIYFPEQTNLRGSGPRTKSPRLKGSFVWVVDDEPVEGDKVADVAKAIGVSVLDFKMGLLKNMEERGVPFDFTDPPKTFAFDFSHGDREEEDGHTVYKIRAARKDSDPEDEGDEDDDSFDEPDENDELFQ